ncbi:MAG: DNA polymerase III subunit alpha [Armatimonadetes bacterium]|nr:DNA polymerase III subunit alpha [Armatimonadota bacterium]
MSEILSIHREAGEWWNYEPYREVKVYIDEKGTRRTTVREMPSLGKQFLDSNIPIGEFIEDHKEDWDLKIQKVRDEKVAKACGLVAAPELKQFQSTPKNYCALHAISGYSFGQSAMLAEEVAAFSAYLSIPCVLLADSFSLAGAYEFVKTAREVGIRPLVGATFEMAGGGEIVLVARSQLGFRSLSRLITECHLDEERLQPICTLERLTRHTEDLLCLTGGALSKLNYLIAKREYTAAEEHLTTLKELYGPGQVFVEIERSCLPRSHIIEQDLIELSNHLQIVPVAGGPITHARPEHYPVQDVLVCADSLCKIDDIEGRKDYRTNRRFLNAERHLCTPEEMYQRYADVPQLVDSTMGICDKCDENVLPKRTRLPQFCENETQQLQSLVKEDIRSRNMKIDKAYGRRLEKELNRIASLGFSGHFLVAWDMCEWARSQGIHFSARGSVVDSVVAFHLRMTRINAWEHHLHFERFLPADGSKRPDIDIDFEAKRREDVRQYLSEKYGREHVATVAAIGAYSTRGIIREVGKVMGVPEESIRFLSKRLHGGISPDKLEQALEKRPELKNINIPKERFRWIFRLAERMTDIPRNMRAHSSGVIISAEPIRDTLPLQHSGVVGVPIIQWDKRSAKVLFDKFDILCLRGQDVLSKTEESIRLKELEFTLDTISSSDEEVFAAFRSGNLIGIPQSASPAMRQAHVRVQTKDLTDASLVQAGIRPGVGGSVKINELIARRRGKPFEYEHPKLREILGNTYGIVVFQEQIDQLLQEFCGYTSGEAEETREAIHKRRREDYAHSIKNQILRRVVDHGYSQCVAEKVFDLVAGFNGYGFAQGHALAFADISIRCVWLQQNHPAEYFAALLNAQPAGYYGPHTIVNEARIRGVKILGPCVNRSSRVCTVEDIVADSDPRIRIPHGAIRIGLDYIAGIDNKICERIICEQLRSTFVSMFDFAKRVMPCRDEMEQLIRCGALDCFTTNRRAMLWAIPHALELCHSGNSPLPLDFDEPTIPSDVADFNIAQKAIYERQILGLDIESHLVAFERQHIASRGGQTSASVVQLPAGSKAFVVGNGIRLRFPPTKSGKRVVFFDLEDECGLLNVTCFDKVYLRDGAAIVCSPYVTVVGEVQDRDGHMAFLAHRVFPYHPVLLNMLKQSDVLPLRTADFLMK